MDFSEMSDDAENEDDILSPFFNSCNDGNIDELPTILNLDDLDSNTNEYELSTEYLVNCKQGGIEFIKAFFASNKYSSKNMIKVINFISWYDYIYIKNNNYSDKLISLVRFNKNQLGEIFKKTYQMYRINEFLKSHAHS